MLSHSFLLSLLPLVQLANAEHLEPQKAFDPFHSCSDCFRSSWTQGPECKTNTILLSTISRLLNPPAAATPTYAPSQWCSDYLRQTDLVTFRVNVTAVSTSTSVEFYQPIVTKTELSHPTLTALCPVPSIGMECGWDSNTISPIEQGLDGSVLNDGIASAEECHQACLQRPACRAYRWDGKIGNPCAIFNVGIGPNAAHLINPTPGGTQWWDRNCPVDIPAGCTLGRYPYSNATAVPPQAIAPATPSALPIITPAPVATPGAVASALSPPEVPHVPVQGLPPPPVIPSPPNLSIPPRPPIQFSLPGLPVVPSLPIIPGPLSLPIPPNLPIPPSPLNPPRPSIQFSLPGLPVVPNASNLPTPPNPPSPSSPPGPPRPPIQPNSPKLPLVRRQAKLLGARPPLVLQTSSQNILRPTPPAVLDARPPLVLQTSSQNILRPTPLFIPPAAKGRIPPAAKGWIPPVANGPLLPRVLNPSPSINPNAPPTFVPRPPFRNMLAPSTPPRPTPRALAKRSIPFPPYFADLNYIWSSVYVTPACSCIISSALPPVPSSTTSTITRHNATLIVTTTTVDPFTVTVTPREATVYISVA
ncbi:hypothetical protein P171DRAFT_696 [Karstenula rhodostoma CBS 690.94]|uniref:Apple domain-containing protein n=1 Tax=Karstenula rhodostoma CBS 690.94 TaxID=1392251 RepID=A0A9P4PTS2_9PLEO|nr:hypothetical protein P171DRAFT_696 [Karstenula rhodostoma CBS 690.94]